jgi:hypothetical protein
MIYVDTSVALAEILAEDHALPPSFWDESLISSRLLEYEVWCGSTRAVSRSHMAITRIGCWDGSPSSSWCRPS